MIDYTPVLLADQREAHDLAGLLLKGVEKGCIDSHVIALALAKARRGNTERGNVFITQLVGEHTKTHKILAPVMTLNEAMMFAVAIYYARGDDYNVHWQAGHRSELVDVTRKGEVLECETIPS